MGLVLRRCGVLLGCGSGQVGDGRLRACEPGVMKLTRRRDIHSVTMARVPIVLAVACVVIAACSADVSTPAQLHSLGSSSPAASADSVVRSPHRRRAPLPKHQTQQVRSRLPGSRPNHSTGRYGRSTRTGTHGSRVGGSSRRPCGVDRHRRKDVVRSDVENQQPDETFGGPRFGPMTPL